MKLTRSDKYALIDSVLREFSTKTTKASGTYAFACGYYESTLRNLIADLPKSEFESLLKDFQIATGKFGA